MFETWLNPLWSEVFAWAWLHSWWQIALAAGLYAGVRGVCRNARARYAAACAALGLALCLPAVTLWRTGAAHTAAGQTAWGRQSLPDEARPGPDETVAPGLAEARAATVNAATARDKQATSWQRRFAAASPYLASLWLVGVVLLALRTLGGWWWWRRVCRGAQPAAERWQTTLASIARRVRVARAARLCETAWVSAPAALGWWRPVILMPLGTLAGMPAAQLEALLAHELAHLRRHDWLVNWLQIALETLLFYHPAVWWLSREIRCEREHLCDDLAVQVTGDAVLYARALTNLELYRQGADWTSVALAANGGNLMQRIQRLIKPQPAPRRVLGGVGLAVLLAATIFGVSALAVRPPAQTAPKRKIAIGFVAVPFTQSPKLKGVDPSLAMRMMIENLKREKVPAVGFVQGAAATDEWSRQLLREWLDAGLELGLGTYSHAWFYGKSYEEYEADVVKNEEAARPILAEKKQTLRYFSYPMLNTGPDLATKTRFEQFLSGRGYQVAKFTIDNDDWIFGREYHQAQAKGNTEAMEKITAEYLPYMARMCDFYEGMSREMFGREIPQILLITTNRMTAEQLPALLEMLRERGYEFVTMEEALRDEAYQSPDTYTGQTGISWLQRWNITRGGQWRPEPKPAGYMEQFQHHKGQSNLKAAPPAKKVQ